MEQPNPFDPTHGRDLGSPIFDQLQADMAATPAPEPEPVTDAEAPLFSRLKADMAAKEAADREAAERQAADAKAHAERQAVIDRAHEEALQSGRLSREERRLYRGIARATNFAELPEGVSAADRRAATPWFSHAVTASGHLNALRNDAQEKLNADRRDRDQERRARKEREAQIEAERRAQEEAARQEREVREAAEREAEAERQRIQHAERQAKLDVERDRVRTETKNRHAVPAEEIDAEVERQIAEKHSHLSEQSQDMLRPGLRERVEKEAAELLDAVAEREGNRRVAHIEANGGADAIDSIRAEEARQAVHSAREADRQAFLDRLHNRGTIAKGLIAGKEDGHQTAPRNTVEGLRALAAETDDVMARLRRDGVGSLTDEEIGELPASAMGGMDDQARTEYFARLHQLKNANRGPRQDRELQAAGSGVVIQGVRRPERSTDGDDTGDTSAASDDLNAPSARTADFSFELPFNATDMDPGTPPDPASSIVPSRLARPAGPGTVYFGGNHDGYTRRYDNDDTAELFPPDFAVRYPAGPARTSRPRAFGARMTPDTVMPPNAAPGRLDGGLGDAPARPLTDQEQRDQARAAMSAAARANETSRRWWPGQSRKGESHKNNRPRMGNGLVKGARYIWDRIKTQEIEEPETPPTPPARARNADGTRATAPAAPRPRTGPDDIPHPRGRAPRPAPGTRPGGGVDSL